MWRKEQLDQELTWEEFEQDLEHLKAWLGKTRPRTRLGWLLAVHEWANGNH